MSLRNMNIAPRAFLGFAIIGTLMLILGVFALSKMNKIRGATEDLANGNVPSIKSLDRFAEVSIRLRVLSYRLLVNRDPETQQKTIDLLAMRNKQITDAQAIYEKLISDPNERNLYGQYVQLLGQYRQLEERLKTLTRANKIEELQNLLNNELLSNSDQMNVVLGKLVEINTAQLNQVKKDASREHDSAFNMVIGLLIAATLLTIVFAWMLIKSITTPIATALHAAETIAKGNLTQPIQIDGSDEAGRLLLAMKTMQDKLRDTLQGISGSATQLASAAEELNAVTDESARGLVQQNNEIEQAATAVNEMTSAVEEVARNAVSTSQASRNAATSAGDGRDLVQETVSAIERMIGSIQSGTEQAVSSMRNSTERAESTLNIAKGAGMALNTINVAVEEINERNMVIASAAEEQAQVAREVDRNLVNIRDLSAQSTTGANQTSAASTELSRLAVDLNSMVSRFAL
ncbi:methyl-accepting chemotaxis protein [Pseudomonas syringae group genomosp. 3]|uniref:Methyl-accepting chemotaxis protein n=1 Tax=Pseudomonas syringae pv. viburni TaxID=251703 RepID=A0A0Q0EZ04_9PSED|nr:methyl-accepting chemotaxis protein [Pseudomonas syringae group genomosp. 3]KPZ15384.1 Methyl-accepting chemotaxis protein [Pseudomonas syringae pv. viburni]